VKRAGALMLVTWNGGGLLDLTPIGMLADMQSRLSIFKNSKTPTNRLQKGIIML